MEYSCQKTSHQETPLPTTCQASNTPYEISEPSTAKDKGEATQLSPELDLPPDYHDFFVDRPESPMKWSDIVNDVESSDNSDPGYVPEHDDSDEMLNQEDFEEEGELHDFEPELEEEEEELVENLELADFSDDELKEARNRVKKRTVQLLEIAQTLQKQAYEGKFGAQQRGSSPTQPDVQRNEPLSEYEESDEEIHTPNESEEDDGAGSRQRNRLTLVSGNTNWKTFQWKVGQRFTTREAFREAVAHYAVSQGRNLSIVGSNKSRLQRMEATCVPGCPFRVYGSWDNGRACFVVKSLKGEHTCNRNMVKNKQLKATWLAKQFLEIFKARPHWPVKEIKETVRRGFKIVIKSSLAYRVKYNAHKLLHGSMKEHYNKLGRYLKAIQNASPESDIELVTVPSGSRGRLVFQRVYFCFDGLRKGWLEGCRKVLCVDACFLKTFLGGHLMAAVGRDANEQMYPVAWAVVEGENNCSWEWFVMKLKSSLQLREGDGLTVISDEHQALLGAVGKVLPNSEHRHCARHIFAHWHKSFRGEDFKLKFWTAAKSYSITDFNEAMVALAEESTAAELGFRGYNPSVFCRAYLNTDTKVDVIVNNLAETFNGYIINSRTKHLIYMLEEIRSNLMQRLVLKRLEIEKCNKMLCPRVQSKLEKEKELAGLCDPMPSTTTKFQVTYYMDTLNVDLEARTCTCRKWDLTGIPCCHAISCIYFCSLEAEDYVHECYKKETYMKSYSVSIPPIEGERHWPQVTSPLDPPPIKIGPGRPRRNRRKDPYEDPKKPGKLTKHGVEMSCSIFRSKTHNKRRCPDKGKEPNPVQQKKQNGRKVTRQSASYPPSQQASTSTAHLEATAQPTRTGRGGRVIRGGVGSRGGRGRGGRDGGRSNGGRGRGGRGGGRGSVMPVGVGVYINADGLTFVNIPGQGGPREVTQHSVSATGFPLGSQTSTANN